MSIRLAAVPVIVLTFTGLGLARPCRAQAAPTATYLNPPGLATSPRYSQGAAVNGGRLVVISGLVATDSTGTLQGAGDLRAQSRRAFENVRRLVEAAGGTVSDIVELRTYLTPGADLAVFREVRNAFLATRTTPPPASTTVVVSSLVTDGALVEIGGLAVLPDPPRRP